MPKMIPAGPFKPSGVALTSSSQGIPARWPWKSRRLTNRLIFGYCGRNLNRFGKRL